MYSYIKTIPLRDTGRLHFIQGTVFAVIFLAVSSCKEGNPAVPMSTSPFPFPGTDVLASKGLAHTVKNDNIQFKISYRIIKINTIRHKTDK